MATTTTTFPLFPLLPAEIRLQIWTLSLSHHTRTLAITCDRGIHPNSRRYVRCFRANQPNPAQLSINRESRVEALRQYTPYLRTEHAPHACIYLAPERDTVRMHEAVLGYLGAPEREVLRRLVLDVPDPLHFYSTSMDELGRMARLAEVEVVVAASGGSAPYRLSEWAMEDDPDVLVMFRRALVLIARANLEWEIPVVRVVSDAGKEMGVIRIDRAELELELPHVGGGGGGIGLPGLGEDGVIPEL
ncbi:hypothetical protein BO71DRAFT_397089 [Aspergillus ellipticus CBS 707.79]|uniref:2EXR domain-containing protein n=1 Tax=Aspergillus ellipticus CBS 707.79 TaxID=1448320 RepID=A0A319E6X8_9EURO|nr:hypothetical protein BO71DRAFT_397089 [Aspergillus ellipticus CBS 707.79]